MTALAPTVESFFTGYLIGQRGASAHTIASYRDTLRLLFGYVHARTGIQPSDLDVADLDAEMVTGFLAALEQTRHNAAQTRNDEDVLDEQPQDALAVFDGGGGSVAAQLGEEAFQVAGEGEVGVPAGGLGVEGVERPRRFVSRARRCGILVRSSSMVISCRDRPRSSR